MNFNITAMKKTLQFIVVAILIFFLASCGVDYTITTRIFSDGSCERIMTARVDSADLKENLFFIPIDSTWTKSTEMRFDTAEKKTFALITVRKKFPSIKALNKEFYKEGAISEIQNMNMKLSRKFRWFHTKYKYEETYIQHFPFRNYPLSTYFSEEEIAVYIFEDDIADSIYYASKDSIERQEMENALDKKAEKFINENIFEELYEEIIRTSAQSELGFFETFSLAGEKNNMLKELSPCLSLIEDNCTDTAAIQLLDKLDILYQTEAFTLLTTIDSLAFETFNKKLNLDCFAPVTEAYEHFVIMPGTLQNTNAQNLVDGNPQWKFDLMNYVFADYTMWAESKKSNKWAYVVTGLLILFSVFLILIRKKSD